jgi:hypothetical protein
MNLPLFSPVFAEDPSISSIYSIEAAPTAAGAGAGAGGTGRGKGIRVSI